MLKYIFKRLILLFLSLAIIVTLTFFLMRLMPGKPTAVLEATKDMKPEDADAYFSSLGLNDGSFEAFGKYIKGIFHGDWGTYYKIPAASIPSIFFHGLRYSLLVTVPAFVIGTILGITFGFISGYKRGKWQDIAINVFVVTFVAVPSFVLAIALILLGDQINLPISYNDSLGLGYEIRSLILPVLVLTLGSFAVLTYYVRNEVVEVLKSDYVLIARSKGVSEKRILLKYILRNVSIPLVTIIIPSFVGLLAGSLIIEQFFSVPGTSTILVQGVQTKELYIVMFSVIFFSFLSLASRLLVDLIYVLIDPRIKIASAGRLTLRTRWNAYRARVNTAKKHAQREVK